MMKKRITKSGVLILAILFSFISVGCSSDDDGAMALSFKATELPDDINRLFGTKGNPESDTVVIFEQGGPVHDFFLDDLEVENVDNFTGFNNFLRVYIHQTNTLNKDLFKAKMTEKEATRELDLNTEILDRVIRHFKSQGKKVHVVGHSFGALIIARYLADKGNTSADKFVMMAGRLDTEMFFVTNFLKGKRYFFRNGDGADPFVDPEREQEITEDDRRSFFLIGVMMRERYTSKIKADNLSNVIFVSARDDDQIGRLTETEKAFLNTKKVKFIEIEKGGHSIMFDQPYIKRIFEEINSQQKVLELAL